MSYDLLKKNFGQTPYTPSRGYFKEFWLIFDILGFKWYKMGQKIKNFVTKKLQLD